MTERTCIVSGVSGAREPMIRFVCAPDGRVLPDVDEKLPGRGAWVTSSAEAVETAVTKNLFSRSFRTGVLSSPELLQQCRDLLQRKVLQYLSLSRKSGVGVAGYAKVESLLASGRASFVIQASDASAPDAEKLQRISPGVPFLRTLDKHKLGQVFGRDEVVYVGMAIHPLSDKLLKETRRLAGFPETDTL